LTNFDSFASICSDCPKIQWSDVPATSSTVSFSSISESYLILAPQSSDAQCSLVCYVIPRITSKLTVFSWIAFIGSCSCWICLFLGSSFVFFLAVSLRPAAPPVFLKSISFLKRLILLIIFWRRCSIVFHRFMDFDCSHIWYDLCAE